jgi:hypothetical protein
VTVKIYDAVCDKFKVGFEVLTAEIIKNVAFWITLAV